jgi:phosphomannomutase
MLAAARADIEGLQAGALAWIADDPSPSDAAELSALVSALPSTVDELADRFLGPLTFGTAGLRGPLRAGPNGMNLAVVRAAAAGLVRWLGSRGASGPLVIGYDARHRSREFALETARVCTGAGRPALVLPGPLPTPVLAYAVRALDAVAGVMVTASHNPPRDNGYKVYLGRELGGDVGAGAQIAPPVDLEISAAIASVGSLRAVPVGPPGEELGPDIVESFVDSVASVVSPDSPRELSFAYTPLHGVGSPVFVSALARAGFAAPSIVDTQAKPDPDFPTLPFPNPEEPGAMDRVVALAADAGADLALANDPDADRCAVAIRADRGWRTLRGDEVGVLLADHLMRRGVTGRYATTIVSSSMLRAICDKRGMPYGETLTGFKWIVRAGADLVFGYEEAIGYCVAPQFVRDKDGISASLLLCELAAGLRATGRTLSDRLDELAAEFGVYATDQVSVRVTDLREIGAIMARLRAAPPSSLLGGPVTVEDLLPGADVLVFRTGSARVVVRPSGTEPKLKAYLEVVVPVDDGVPASRQVASRKLQLLTEEIQLLTQK